MIGKLVLGKGWLSTGSERKDFWMLCFSGCRKVFKGTMPFIYKGGLCLGADNRGG